ncbi:hypothetical protein [Campylobacter concisus]|uniref:hypothetical protein n=1 Tax=Campylobacter concisus TaxID=199 RepID=UPI00165F8ED8|nr:hypothetical protein [Campylobacter concisus]
MVRFLVAALFVFLWDKSKQISCFKELFSACNGAICEFSDASKNKYVILKSHFVLRRKM